MGRIVAMVLLVSLLLGGCTSAPAPKQEARPSATFSDDTGGIEGIVVDDEEVPVPSAIIRIVGLPQVTNTTEDGRFAFSNLAPNSYILLVERTGFIKRQVPTQVPVGNATHVKVILMPVPPPTPYADVGFIMNGYVRGGYSYRVANVGGNGTALTAQPIPEAYRSTNSGRLLPKSGWQSILFEVDWKPSSGQSDQLALQLTFPEKLTGGAVSTANKAWVAGGNPVLKWRWDREHFEEARKAKPNLAFDTFVGIDFLVLPATDPAGTHDVGVYLEQKFTVYGTIGYNGPLEPGYSRLGAR